MLIAVVADTHGETEEICRHLQAWKLDVLIFAGDYYRDGEKIAKSLQIPYHGVRGNCDRNEPRAADEEIITIKDKKFYILHGHLWGVKQCINRMYYRALERKADVVVYGHTHVAHLEQIDHLWLINPGSASRPRIDKRGSYVLIDWQQEVFSPQLIKM